MTAVKTLTIFEWRALMERMQRLERLAEQAVILSGGGGSGQTYIEVGGGNWVDDDSTVQGVLHVNSSIASVPTAYDPSTEFTTGTDGIGWGQVYGTNEYVLIINDDRVADNFSFASGRGGLSLGAVSIPVDGGGSITCHILAVFL